MIYFLPFLKKRKKYHPSAREITRRKNCAFNQDVIKVMILPPDKVGIELSHFLPGSEKTKANILKILLIMSNSITLSRELNNSSNLYPVKLFGEDSAAYLTGAIDSMNSSNKINLEP
jgi:hypothetical protein